MQFAVVALDQRGRVALQAFNLHFAKTVARASVVMSAEPGLLCFGVDFGGAIEQFGGGVFAAEQLRQDMLLGLVPLLLAEGLADRQAPVGNQIGPGFCLNLPVDRNINAGNPGAWARIDFDPDLAFVLGKLELRRKVALGGQNLAE